MKTIFLMMSLISITAMAGNLSAILSAAGGGSSSSNSGQVKRAFVTSTNYNGNLGGLAGANAKCQERATAAGLTGQWKALIGSGASYAIKQQVSFQTILVVNMKNEVLWTRMGLTNYNNKVDAQERPWGGLPDYYNSSEAYYRYLINHLGYDEFGTFVSKQVWVGATESGSSSASSTCLDWTDGTAGQSGQSGRGGGNGGFLSSVSARWMGTGAVPCNNLQGLYCIEQ